jgi:hypothetical protein
LSNWLWPQNKTEKEENLTYFGEKNHVKKTVSKKPANLVHSPYAGKINIRSVRLVLGDVLF